MDTDANGRSVREEIVELLPDHLKELADEFVALELDVDEVQVFVDTLTRGRRPLVQEEADRRIREDVAVAAKASPYRNDLARSRAAGVHVTNVRVVLTAQQKQYVRGMFMGATELAFMDDVKGMDGEIRNVAHGVLHTTRKVMAVQMWRTIPAGDTVLEAGASPIDAIMRGVRPGKYYGAVPVLDARDAARKTSYDLAARVLMRASGRKALKPDQKRAAEHYLAGGGEMFFRSKVEHMHVAADFAISHHSTYDIPLSTLVLVMQRCGVRTWMGNMLNTPGLGFYRGRMRGSIGAGACTWVADADADHIKYAFEGESSYGYSHSLSIVREYNIHPRRVFRCGSDDYVFEHHSLTNEVDLVFTITRVTRRDDYAGALRTYAPCADPGMVTVKTFSVDLTKSVGDADRFVPVEFSVSEDMLTRVLQDQVLKAERGTVETVMEFAQSARLNVVHNGVRVSCSNPMSVNQFRVFAVAVHALATDIRRAGTLDVAETVAMLGSADSLTPSVFTRVAETVSMVTDGPSSLIKAVHVRMGQLLDDGTYVPHVVRPPQYQCVDIADVDLGAGVRELSEIRSKCRCAEIRELDDILRGERGGVTVAETKSLVRYRQRLGTCGCEYARFDMQEAMEAADEDVYEDAVSEISTVEDSNEAESASETAVDTPCTEYVSEDEREVCSVIDEDCTTELPVAEGPVRSAVCEYAEILDLQIRAAYSQARHFVAVMRNCGQMDAEKLRACTDDQMSHWLLRVGPKGVIAKVEDGDVRVSEFKIAYDWERDCFVDLFRIPGSSACMVREGTSSMLYTCTAFMIWNQPQILRNIQRCLRDPLVGPQMVRYEFINGVFGCGKTTEICREYKPGRMYLSASRRSVDTVRRRLYGLSPVGKEMVRTFDSACCKLPEPKQDVVMDEVPMAHAGQVLYLLYVLRPETVKMYGDFFQQPYVACVAGRFTPLYASIATFCDITMRPLTHRCRLSVCAGVLPHYGLDSGLAVCHPGCHERMTQEDCITRTVISSAAEVPMVRGAQYLTMTQEDSKAVFDLLVNAGYEKIDAEKSVRVVSTGVEAQGEEYDRVIFVRLSTRSKPDSVFHEPHRMNTTVTRTMNWLDIYTMSHEEDQMTTFWRNSQNEVYRQIVRDNSRAAHEELGYVLPTKITHET